MKAKKLIVYGVFFLASLNIVLANTEVADSVVGSWVDTSDPEEYLVFKMDGTWEWNDTDSSRSWGRWSQFGRSISAQGNDWHGNHFSTKGKIKSTGIIYFPQFVETNSDGSPHAEEFKRVR